METVPDEFAFRMGDRTLHSIGELKAALEKASDQEYSAYAGFGYNHFSNWIRDVIKDKDLADRLRSAKDRHEAIIILSPHPETKVLQPYTEIKAAEAHHEPAKALLESKDKAEAKESVHDHVPVQSPHHPAEHHPAEHHPAEHHASEHPASEHHRPQKWHKQELATSFALGMMIGFIMGIIIARMVVG